MSKFRKIPVIIEAVQFTEQNPRAAYEFIYGAPFKDPATVSMEERWYDYENIMRRDGLKLKTLESDGETQVARIGDWIIKGIQGEFYPIKEDIFLQTYEPVD